MTEPERHEPPIEDACGATRDFGEHLDDGTHVCSHDGRCDGTAHACDCGFTWTDDGAPTSPVAAEGLRERIDDVIADWATDPQGRHLGDLVVAALAGGPGDLPALMHTAMRKAVVKWAALDIDDRRGVEFSTFLTVAAMSVRWEDAAHWQARAVYAEGQLSARRGHETRWQAEHAEVERLQAELAEIERVTTPPDADLEIPTDPAELRELWEFINRQTRWQYHMAHKFGGRVGQLRAELAEAYLRVNELSKKEDQQFRRAEKAEAERDELKAANERARERHQPHDCRDHVFAKTPVPCVNADLCRCGSPLPCSELAAIDAALAAPEAPGDAETKPKHIGRANAEDCPACDTSTMPYPWICPGEPETPGDAERIADERPTGVHAFEQNPAATQVSVCICGKWRDHHMHGADPCGCDACRTPGDAKEADRG